MEVKELLYYNGFGGFSKDGKKYIIKTNEKFTPLPWSHVIANENFGTLVTSSGGGYVWSGNSRENKITTWCNNQVTDESSEKITIKDLTSGEEFSVLPHESLENYEIHYGFGYAKFCHYTKNLRSEMLIYVPKNRNEKICVLEIENKQEDRIIELSYYINLVLGVARELTQKHIIYENIKNGSVVQNSYRDVYKDEKIRIEILESESEVEKVFDKNNNLKLKTKFRISGDHKKKIIIRISAEKMTEFPSVKEDMQEIQHFWDYMTNKIIVKTPTESFNIMMNGWLIYQTLACRLWARTSFYQCGGAYGFRDQLQDTLMFLNLDSEITKKQIIYHANHEFEEGDVMHWWHKEKNNGIKTRCSDDMLWLPFSIAKYIEVTNDYTILDEICEYVTGPNLSEDQDELYFEAVKSDKKDNIYNHALKAIDISLKFGEHGLPLMGSCDWNDGMNKIRGESVWLGFFMYDILTRFEKICEKQGDLENSRKYSVIAENLKKSLNENAWDGKWFRRAFFEDKAIIGSEISSECKIDGISQSFSVISNGADKEKQEEAMKSLDKNLVDRENMLIKLLTPAFSKSDKNPGYIKSYISGVRENGGQYTHGAVWAVIANAILGNGEKAVEYFKILNSIEHARTQDAALKYKVEPYVISADIYSNPNMVGRGGWTWYTGSSSWLYTAGLEYILGIKRRGKLLEIQPVISKDWEQYTVEYNYEKAKYIITVYNQNKKENGVQKIYLNNEIYNTNMIELFNEGEHKVDVII